MDDQNVAALKEADVSKLARASDVAFSVFLRILSILILVVAVLLWARVIGAYGPDILTTFNRDNHIAIVMGILAVTLPSLGVGLWLGMRWGTILWGFAGFGLTISHFSLEKLPLEFYTLGAVLSVLLIFYLFAGLILYFVNKEKAED